MPYTMGKVVELKSKKEQDLQDLLKQEKEAQATFDKLWVGPNALDTSTRVKYEKLRGQEVDVIAELSNSKPGSSQHQFLQEKLQECEKNMNALLRTLPRETEASINAERQLLDLSNKANLARRDISTLDRAIKAGDPQIAKDVRSSTTTVITSEMVKPFFMKALEMFAAKNSASPIDLFKADKASAAENSEPQNIDENVTGSKPKM